MNLLIVLPERISVLQNNGVAYTDDGVSWTDVALPFPNGMDDASYWLHVHAILRNMLGSQTYLLAAVAFQSISSSGFQETAGAIYRSDDHGETWQIISMAGNQTIGPISSIQTSPTDAHYVYAQERPVNGSGGAIWRSEDGGATWTQAGMVGHDQAIFAIDSSDALSLYIDPYQKQLCGYWVLFCDKKGVIAIQNDQGRPGWFGWTALIRIDHARTSISTVGEGYP